MSQVGFGALLPLLLVLTSGWIVLRSRYGKTFMWWQSGYNLYFRIAFAGIIMCLVPGLIVATVLTVFNLVGSSCVNDDAKFLSSFQCQQEIFTLAAWLTPLMGLFGYAVGSFWPSANSPRLKKKYENIVQGKSLENYIKNTMEEGTFLLITLKSRKVYIGMVMDSSLQFNELDVGEEKYLRVLVTLSGYRSDTDMQMCLTVDYNDEELRKFIQESDKPNTKLEAMIPVKEIASIQPFDPRIYRKFFMDRDGMERSNPHQRSETDSLP